ncbi:MAG: metallophosphoesterase family protein, partial [Desulfomonilaceae bacterium]
MKNQNILTLAFALVVAYSAVVGAEEKFRFAVFSDTRGNLITKSCLDDNAGISSILPIVRDHVLKINETEPIHLVVFPGDMVTGYFPRDADSTAECNRIQLTKWRQIMKPFLEKEIMVRVTIGNHEAEAFDPSKEDIGCGEHGQQYLPSYENFQVFKDALGDMLGEGNGPESDLGLTYSFDLDGCHFVVLTSYTMYENNSFSNETINWLDKDLEIAKDKGYKLFVTSHPPAFPGGGHTWDSLPFFDPTYACSDYSGIDRRKDRDRFWNILKKHKVIAYFCGHEHNTQIQLVEGCWQVTIGGLTSELYKFNGVEDDTQRNLILYEGHFQ